MKQFLQLGFAVFLLFLVSTPVLAEDKTCYCNPNQSCPDGGSTRVAACHDNKGNVIGWESCGFVGCSCEITKSCSGGEGGGGGGGATGCKFQNVSTGNGYVRYSLAMFSGTLVGYDASGACGPATAGPGDPQPLCFSGMGQASSCGGHTAINKSGTCYLAARMSDGTSCTTQIGVSLETAISCQGIDISGGTTVAPGETKTLTARYQGEEPVSFNWQVESAGNRGSLSSLGANPTSWTAPSAPGANQNWKVTLRVVDKGSQTDSCQKQMTFGGTDTHKACVNHACVVVPGGGGPQCARDSDCGGSTANGYFLTLGGNIEAVGNVTNPNLPQGKAYAANTPGAHDAGAVLANNISLAAGALFSENGGGNGWNVQGYGSQSLRTVSYENLLTNTLNNAGYASLVSVPCAAGGGFDAAPFRFWCYTNSASLDSLLERARNFSDPDISYHIFIPFQGQSLGGLTLDSEHQIKNINVVFAPGGLRVAQDLKVLGGKAALAIISDGAIGAGGTKNLDGVLVFNNFGDGSSTEALTGHGSLIGLGQNALGGAFQRNAGGTLASEVWSYDSRGLDLMRNVLAKKHYHWRELPPR